MPNGLIRPAPLLLLALCILAISSALANEPAAPNDIKVVLERVAPLSPEESLATIEVADGFRIELVAAEPLVVDPVAMAFDEHGRLYVIEMRDYSEQDTERLGRVRLLIDENGDVIAARLLKSLHPAYDAQLVKAARSWKYRPARKNGTAVRTLKLVNVRVDGSN